MEILRKNAKSSAHAAGSITAEELEWYGYLLGRYPSLSTDSSLFSRSFTLVARRGKPSTALEGRTFDLIVGTSWLELFADEPLVVFLLRCG
jgi:hypothetical protein